MVSIVVTLQVIIHMISSSAPQPPMELLTTGLGGVVNIIKNDNQSNTEEASFGEIFAVDNSNYTVYYVESSAVFGMPLRNPQHAFVSFLYTAKFW